MKDTKTRNRKTNTRKEGIRLRIKKRAEREAVDLSEFNSEFQLMHLWGTDFLSRMKQRNSRFTDGNLKSGSINN